MQNTPYKILNTIYFAILALLPVHAVLSVWLTSNFGYGEVWQGWKEALLLGSGVLVLIQIIRHPDLRRWLTRSLINRLIIAYGLLHLLLAMIFRPPLVATLVGLAMNLRFFGMFLLAQLLVKQNKPIRQTALKLVGAGVLLVVAFGFLQATVLPDDTLRHVGYSRETIQPFRTIDENPDLVRINSTLRGPSPLGLYLVFVIALFAAANSRSWELGVGSWAKKRWLVANVGVAALITLYATYSRSAWLASVLAVGTVVGLRVPVRWRKRVGLVAAGTVVAASLLVGVFWQTNYLQQALLHRDPAQGIEINSDDERFGASQAALQDVAQHPLGSGPGTAGPASFYGDQDTKIAENYYLQIGQEVGWIGLGLFVAICWQVALLLWRKRNEPVPRALLASFIGLAVANLFVHGWAQDEIALIWWGLAGLYVHPPQRSPRIDR
jgi:hypothetical protein